MRHSAQGLWKFVVTVPTAIRRLGLQSSIKKIEEISRIAIYSAKLGVMEEDRIESGDHDSDARTGGRAQSKVPHATGRGPTDQVM